MSGEHHSREEWGEVGELRVNMNPPWLWHILAAAGEAGVVWPVIAFSDCCQWPLSVAEAETKCCFVVAGTPAQLQPFLPWDVLPLQNSECFPAIWEQRVEGHAVLFWTEHSHCFRINGWGLGWRIRPLFVERDGRQGTNKFRDKKFRFNIRPWNSQRRRLKALLCQKTVCDVVIELQIPALCFFRFRQRCWKFQLRAEPLACAEPPQWLSSMSCWSLRWVRLKQMHL